MEQALEVGGGEPAEAWDQVVVDVADQADLLRALGETAFVPTVVNASHIKLQPLVLSVNVPSAGP
jgi:hypothetical protein